MSEREKLVELLSDEFHFTFTPIAIASVAEYLLSHGVAVPVRCGECKYYRNHPNGLCFLWTEPSTNDRGWKGDAHCVEPDDFCSYGERKDNETD